MQMASLAARTRGILRFAQDDRGDVRMAEGGRQDGRKMSKWQKEKGAQCAPLRDGGSKGAGAAQKFRLPCKAIPHPAHYACAARYAASASAKPPSTTVAAEESIRLSGRPKSSTAKPSASRSPSFSRMLRASDT